MKNVLIVAGIIGLLTLGYFMFFSDKKGNTDTDIVATSTITDETILTFNVGPEQVDCVGVGPQKCLVVNDEYFYDSIEGFTFEEGYSYVLKVERNERENVPADASAYTYRLIEEVSKTKATSAGTILQNTAWQWEETIYTDAETVTAQNPESFILSFMDDSRFSATTDCNGLMGGYEENGDALTFSQIASTKKACLGDTQEEVFTDMLNKVTSYNVTIEGNLLLDLDTGTMIFTPVAQ